MTICSGQKYHRFVFNFQEPDCERGSETLHRGGCQKKTQSSFDPGALWLEHSLHKFDIIILTEFFLFSGSGKTIVGVQATKMTASRLVQEHIQTVSI